MKITKTFITISIISLWITNLSAQSFGLRDLSPLNVQSGEAQAMESFEESFAFERKIDPNVYILGPGDELGLNILTSENITYPLKVTPTGDLFIPSVGVVHVAGYTLTQAISNVKDYIHTHAYPGAKVNLVLVNVRVFKIQISGAVNKPGFVKVNPMERLSDIVIRSGGFHQLAREFDTKIIRNDGQKITVNYVGYLREGDLGENPMFQEGDRIYVPFAEMKNEGIVLRGAVAGSGYDIIEPNETLGAFLERRVKFNKNADLENVIITRKVNGGKILIEIAPQEFFSTKLHAGDTIDILWEKGVMVNGFVLTPGGFGFFPGYVAADYISMAGGNTPSGNPNRCTVKHRDGTVERGQEVVIRRGDVIVVPRTIKDAIIGDMSALHIVVSLATVYLTYLATL